VESAGAHIVDTQVHISTYVRISLAVRTLLQSSEEHTAAPSTTSKRNATHDHAQPQWRRS
jgi:hypothetical protein